MAARKHFMTLVKFAAAVAIVWVVLASVRFDDQFQLADGRVLAVRLDESGARYRGEVLDAPEDLRGLEWLLEPSLGLKFSVPGEVVERNCDVRLGLRSLLRDSDVGLLGLFALVQTACWFLTFIRLYYLLRTQEIVLPFSGVVKLSFIGLLFNNFLPSTVGGDVVKGLYLSRYTPHKMRVVAVLLLDRILGLSSLATMAGISILFKLDDPGFYGAGLLVLAMDALALVSMLCYFHNGTRYLIFYNRLIQRLPIRGALHNFAVAGQNFSGSLRTVGGCLLLSVACNITYFVANWGYAMALGSSVIDFMQYFLIIPVALFVSSVPVGPGGFGLREYSYTVLFEKYGETATLGFSVSIVVALVNLTLGLPGLYFWLTHKQELREQAEVVTRVAGPAAAVDDA